MTAIALQLSLPWPPSALSPNRRQHWHALAKAKKRYRNACFLTTRTDVDVMAAAESIRRDLPNGSLYLICHGPLTLSLDFHPPNRRSFDRDNLLARMKSGLDGMCDALGIDDSAFASITVAVGEVRKGGEVVVRIGAVEAVR